MFDFVSKLDQIPREEAIEGIFNFVKCHDKISKKELISKLAPHIPIQPGDEKVGWSRAQIEKELECWAAIRAGDVDITFYLDDPVNLNELGEFDAVSHPSHYAEGRKYEPRKVIADWGLNFNLGNAVKYISRAGRKNDMIENLRKAIRYIEFEIEECSGESQGE